MLQKLLKAPFLDDCWSDCMFSECFLCNIHTRSVHVLMYISFLSKEEKHTCMPCSSVMNEMGFFLHALLPLSSLICMSATLAASGTSSGGVMWCGHVRPAMIGRPISLSYLPWPSSVHIKSCTPAYTALSACRHGSIETAILVTDLLTTMTCQYTECLVIN